MKEKPIFTTGWSKKSEKTKKEENAKLKDTFGYDE